MNALIIVGRILFAVPFIYNGWNHFAQGADMVGYATMMGAPLPGLTVPLTGLMLVLGGLSILLGYYEHIGGWLLVAFLVLAAFIMHPFWAVDPSIAATETSQFLKNIALAGAAILVIQLSPKQNA